MAIPSIRPTDLNLPATVPIDISWALTTANSPGHPDGHRTL